MIATKKEKTGCVRATRIEIFGFGKQNESRDNWRQLAVDCQRMTNRLWQIWLCHHSNNGSVEKLRNHFDAYKKWKETKQGDKPQWPCKAFENPLTSSAHAKSFYRILSAEFPGVHVRTRGLLTNAWQSKVNTRKAASGSLPAWVSILFANESLPSFTRPQPIPFDRDNAELFERDGKIYLRLRIERLSESGKSVVEDCELILNRRKTASARATVNKIIKGEYVWKGSNLVFDHGKWYAALSYSMPIKQRPEVDVNKVLIVRPGKKSPWRVTLLNGSFRQGGDGRNIEYARRAIQRERNERSTHYRWAGSNQKGHGRRRAEEVWTKLSSRWRDKSKRYNNEVTRTLVTLAINLGCGRIIYCQPKDSDRDSRYLSIAGKDERSKMTWDYSQFGTMLASKCEQEGIEYENAANRVRQLRKTNEPKRGKRP